MSQTQEHSTAQHRMAQISCQDVPDQHSNPSAMPITCVSGLTDWWHLANTSTRHPHKHPHNPADLSGTTMLLPGKALTQYGIHTPGLLCSSWGCCGRKCQLLQSS